MNAILTIYPIPHDFQQRLSSLIKDPVVRLSLSELRKLPLIKLVTYLCSLRVKNIYLPIQDETEYTLLPILKLVAAFTPARSIYVVDQDIRITQISRLRTFVDLFRVAKASVHARIAVSRTNGDISRLLADEKYSAAPNNRTSNSLLYINANLWVGVKAGGSVGHVSGVINAMLDRGLDVHYASSGGRLMIKDAASYIHLVPPRSFCLPPEFNHYPFDHSVVEQLRPYIEQHQFDFIYQRLSISNFTGVALSRSFGIPLVLEYNGSEAWIARNWGRHLREQRLAEQIEEANLRHADLVVTISDVLKDELLARGIPSERIVTYPNCIDPEVFSPSRYSSHDCSVLRKRYAIPQDASVVTFVGTFGQWHGVEVLAKAIMLLINEYSEWLQDNKVRFLLVGDGIRMPEVTKILGEHSKGSFVVLAGLVPQSDAPLYLAASDILASPHVANSDGSKFFGSPTKLFEYMAMGKAIVASNLDQIGDILQNSVRLEVMESDSDSEKFSRVALLVQPGDVEQLAEGIRYLVNSPGLCGILGRNARSLALSKYTWHRHVDEIMTGLKRVLH